MLPQPAFVTRVNERRAPGYSGREQSGDIVEFLLVSTIGRCWLPIPSLRENPECLCG